MARPRNSEIERRRKEFVRLLTEGHDPVEAHELSGHPAIRALEVLRDLGFTLTVLDGRMDVAA